MGSGWDGEEENHFYKKFVVSSFDLHDQEEVKSIRGYSGTNQKCKALEYRGASWLKNNDKMVLLRIFLSDKSPWPSVRIMVWQVTDSMWRAEF